MKKLVVILTLAVLLVGVFSAVALGANGTRQIPEPGPTVDPTHPQFYDGHGGTDKTVNPHGGFSINGDTCSACHSIHYAGNNTNLTVTVGTASATCLGCHDGTIAQNYDVIHGHNGSGGTSEAGAFTAYLDPNAAVLGNVAYASASMHDCFGSVQAYAAAPGGKGSTGLDAVKDATGSKGTWATSSFACTNCHDVHTAVNPRLLATNPNGIQNAKAVVGEAAVTAFGGATAATYSADTTTKYWFKAAPASGIKVYVAGVKLNNIADYQVKWERDPNAATPQFKDDYAYVTITKSGLNPGDAVTFDYIPALIVEMNISNYNQANETIQYGNGINEFCTACHTDMYLRRTATQAPANTDKGFWNGLYHHSGNRSNNGSSPMLGNYTPSGTAAAGQSVGSCLTCHYAHGVNQTIWKNASTADASIKYVDASGNALFDSPEVAGSSSLKRSPNTSMCIFCHDKISYNGN